MYFFNLVNFKNIPLFRIKSHSTGRSKGRITVNHRSAGSRFNFVSQSNNDTPLNCLSQVYSIIKRPLQPDLYISVFETGFIGLFLSPNELFKGSFILNSLNPLPIKFGNTMPLKFIPVGSRVYNVDNIARTAGVSIQILRHKAGKTLCRLPSSELKWFNSLLMSTVGVLSNSDRRFYKFYKAGQLRWLGRRPTTRGTAMNPIDHPHGGGQGKTSGGRPSVSPKARLTKGYRTVRTKRNKNIFKTRYAK